ncbi:differentially expressed in FDCP 8 homolog isoform X2 [Anopheles gambiae]|uniref:differentially expressed in FDCP 8 homolog isoform X2 n=1 Tax=Anopheles gambiae TaxID=7165 RepID=UPI002AC904C1|nr:differentially expressed in FDCP 8 homolog isoform X2 [Anopheles gambiae]
MQSTVQNLREGLWNLPSTVNSLLLAGTLLDSGRGSSSEELTREQKTRSPAERDDNNNDDAEEEPPDSDQEDDELPEKRTHASNRMSAEPMSSSVGSLRALCDEPEQDERGEKDPTATTTATNTAGPDPAVLRVKWQLVPLDQNASLVELSQAIDVCRTLVRSNAYGPDTDQSKWLVRHLVELRYRYRELVDFSRDPEAVLEETEVILGHHFVRRKQFPLQQLQRDRHLYCDHCSGVIWNVVQASYVCNDCSFTVHHKCLRNVLRICAHVVTTEHKLPIECICPEIGLAFQKYTCAECGTQLSYNTSTSINCFGLEFKAEKLNSIQPRLCDYTGLYYCPACHWNDTSIIPARITNNWDFVPRKVCRASRQQINLLLAKPVIRLEEKNPRLFTFIPQLAEVKRARVQLGEMKRYLIACRLADETRLVVKQIGKRRHLMESIELYSVADLVGVEDGTLLNYLRTIRATFEHHIRNCVVRWVVFDNHAVTGTIVIVRFSFLLRSAPVRRTSASFATTIRFCSRSMMMRFAATSAMPSVIASATSAGRAGVPSVPAYGAVLYRRCGNSWI